MDIYKRGWYMYMSHNSLNINMSSHSELPETHTNLKVHKSHQQMVRSTNARKRENNKNYVQLKKFRRRCS